MVHPLNAVKCGTYWNELPRRKQRGIKPYRFYIALQVIKVISVICGICGLNLLLPFIQFGHNAIGGKISLKEFLFQFRIRIVTPFFLYENSIVFSQDIARF